MANDRFQRAADLMRQLWKFAKDLFRKHPQLSMAVVVFILGFLAILIHFPSEKGSTTLAGALFGSGAAFIGAWVAERKKTIEDTTSKDLRAREARDFFAPELGRVVARQTQILDRIAANFITTSVGRQPLVDPLSSFRPRKPTLYPTASDRRDLCASDASLLVEFYNATQDMDETIDLWERSGTKVDFNAFNVLLQQTMHSLALAREAVLRFCPGQPYSAIIPAAGTLLNVIDRSLNGATAAFNAHMERNNPHQPWLADRPGNDTGPEATSGTTRI